MVKKITKEEVKKFVMANLERANHNRIECGDGRYTREQSEGAIRAFGGDFGMVMAFAGALKDKGVSLSSEEIIDRYYNAVKIKRGPDTKLYYHSDTHNNEEGGIGCGHIANATNPDNDGRYGSLTHQDVKALYDNFKNHTGSHLTILDGPHKEQAVIFVFGESEDSDIRYSVNSMDNHGNMYFVVDIDRIERFITKATPHFSKGLEIPILAEDVKRNFVLQMKATAKILAANLDEHNVVINPRGDVSMVWPASQQSSIQN